MKSPRYAKFTSADLRDVITIIEHRDGRIVVTALDRVTLRRSFIDDYNDVAIAILDKEGIALV